MAKFQDLTGKTFGNLTVIAQDDPYISPSGVKFTRWRVKCELCGQEKSMVRNTLIYATSCGCQRIARIRQKGRLARNKKICPICGNEFFAPPSGNVTCSKRCASEYISRRRTGQTLQWSDSARQRFSQSPAHLNQARAQASKASEAAMALPDGQRGPQHRDSKVWIVKSPDNVVFKIVGISQWARANYRLFEPDSADPEATAHRIRSGFSQMSSSLSGALAQKGRCVSQYKGWQLISVCTKTEQDQFDALKQYESKQS